MPAPLFSETGKGDSILVTGHQSQQVPSAPAPVPQAIPVPDPTVLTTEQLIRQVACTREILETLIEGTREIMKTRIDAGDKAIVLLQEETNRIPAKVDEKINALRGVHDEKFSSIQIQFKERDTRTDQAAGAVKIAVDAALQAQKEAVSEQNKSSALAIAKSETMTLKQIDQLGTLINTTSKGLDDKISDLKERLTRIEGRGEGNERTIAVHQTAKDYTFGIVSLVVGALVGMAGIITGLLRGG